MPWRCLSDPSVRQARTSAGHRILRCGRGLVVLAIAACTAPQQPKPQQPPPTPPPAAKPADDTAFPSGWLGAWRGTLHISPIGKPAYTMPMELHIEPLAADRWTFRIVYDGKPRNYVLIAKDLATGDLVVDEQNSIVIDTRLVGDTLFSHFAVMDNFVQARYRRTGTVIAFDIVMWPTKDPNKTGGGSGAPEVLSYPVRMVQHATLSRS